MLLLIAAGALAAPLHLPHQARLTDASGEPVNGSHTLAFELTSGSDGSGLLWSRSYPSAPFGDGYVSVMLEDGDPTLDSSLFDGSDVYLTMSVDGQPVGGPTPIGGTVFAAHASSVTGPVQATEVRVGGTLVIDSEGRVHGRGPTDLVCPAGESPVHDGSDWICAANTRTDAEIAAVVESTDVAATVGFTVGGQSVAFSENIRTIVTKSTANSYCGGTAIHVPWSYRGQTGDQICAADARNRTTCTAVKYVYITNNNSYGTYSTNDPGCGAPLAYPWPWGSSYSSPNTLDGEWGHGTTYVVCCQ